MAIPLTAISPSAKSIELEEAAIPNAPPPPASSILLTGTLAIDYLGSYGGAFSTLPRHPGINLSVQLARIARHFGGCAMNIAYTLQLLGQKPAPFVFAGQDFEPHYAAHLAALGMNTSGIQLVDAPYSAHGFVFTDQQQNQFTAFYGGPGAVVPDYASRLLRFAKQHRFEYAVLAPDLPQNMIAAAAAMREAGIPFLCDPGQNLTDFSPEDCRALLRLSDSVIVNQFEHATLQRAAMAELQGLDLLIVTLGEDGASWRSTTEGEGREAAAAAQVVDPTGCGDAFRAGFVDAKLRGASLAEAVRRGSVAAAIVLESPGCQSHRCDDFEVRCRGA